MFVKYLSVRICLYNTTNSLNKLLIEVSTKVSIYATVLMPVNYAQYSPNKMHQLETNIHIHNLIHIKNSI